MEIGQKIIQANNNISDRNLVLTIQVGLNGFSFLIVDRFENKIYSFFDKSFEKKITPEVLLEKIIEEFKSEENLQLSFSKIQVIHDNEMQTLVPAALFEESNLSDYLKYNTKIFKTDFITYDVISNQDIMLVYVPFVNINNFIFEKYGSFEYKHNSTVLIERILQINSNKIGNNLFVNVNLNYFELVILKSSSLVFYNRFEYTTKEDFIYYILFTIEQLDLNVEKINSTFFGKISTDDELFLIAYKYIRNVSILAIEKMNYFKEENTSNFTILNSIK